MNIGLIARYDNSGLGTLSREFARHLKPHKVLLVQNGRFQTFPDRYKDFDTRKMDVPDKTIIDWFLDKTDIILSFETMYYWPIIKECRARGVKSVLMPMYEMTPAGGFPLMPDLILCPSKLDYDVFKDYSTRVEYLPVPIARDRLIWRKRTRAKHFIHSGSHGGMNKRKGTPLILEAMKYVKKNIKLTIYTWDRNLRCDDSRVEIRLVNFKNYWQMWREGDVLIYPQDYNGICLPIVEALASGMGVITTDIYPFNEYMPKKLLFKPDSMYRTRASSNLMEVDAAKISPEALAKKIDEVAGKDISKVSLEGKAWAEKYDWPEWIGFYRQVLKSVL